MNWLFVGGVVAAGLFVLKQLFRRGSGSGGKAYFLRYDGVHEVVRFESLRLFSIQRGGGVENLGFNDGDVLDVYDDGYLLIDASLVKRLAAEVRSKVQVTKQELLTSVEEVIKAKKAAGVKQR